MSALSRRSNQLRALAQPLLCQLCARLCPPEPTPPPPPPPQRRLEYFVPGQINVVVLHPNGLSQARIARLIRSDPLLASGLLPGQLAIAPQRIITFELKNREQAFSLGFIDVPRLRDDPARLVQLIHALNRQIAQRQDRSRTTGARPTGADDTSHYDPAAGTTGAASQADQAPAADPRFPIQLAAPNWLSSGAPYVGGGGPGSRPIPVPAVSISTSGQSGKQPWETSLPPNLLDRLATGETGGQPVEVVILDTLPGQNVMNAAHSEWGASNPLIDNLLGPAGTLKFQPNTGNIMQLADGTLAAFPFPMPDHGLFVASIIRSLAPDADITLVETLNPYGLGTVETIAAALQQFLNRPPDANPLLINLSLVLNIPTADQLDALKAQDPLWEPFTQQTLAQSSQALEVVCSTLRDQNIFLLAAAGNDGDPTTGSHPFPHYPAAYHSVFGVGALNANGDPAPYSNACDDLLAEGMAVFGGDLDPSLNGDPDQQHGIVGVYVSTQFPDPLGQENKTGLARWAGTSFATPMLTGTIAKLLGSKSAATPEDAIALLRASDADPVTPVGEKVTITQG